VIHPFFGNFSLTLYLLATLPFFLDFVDLILRLYLRREQTLPLKLRASAATSIPLNVGEFSTYEMRLHLRPYAIVLSVHNIAGDLDRFLHSMSAFRDRLWFIDDGSTDRTAEQLAKAGVQWVRGETNRQKPAALKALLLALPSDIATVIVFDPDSRIVTGRAELERVLFQFQQSGMAALCPRLAIRPDGWLTRPQELEYWLAFSIGRKSLADFSITSGIAVYRRDALHEVLAQHSLSVYAEDLENSLILLAQRERVYYDGRIVVETEGMREPSKLFSQRVGWHFGLIRVYVDRSRALMACARQSFGFAYQFVIYMGLFVLLLHPLKVLAVPLLALSALNTVDTLAGQDLIADSTLTNPLYSVGLYVKYTGLILFIIPLAVGRGSRRRTLLVAPFYTLYAVGQIVPATVGYANWITMRLWGRRVYRDHYQPAAP
jgi:cellulose synthase/poly-beta-1,6-N-acetylglucosamine synthase-like glycosyltransferase